MNNGVKLSFFFAVSVALHGAGLWAFAGRIEPRPAEPPAEVAIVDRDLFFRHAARSELRPTQPMSGTTVRLDASPAQALEPHQQRDSADPAPVAAASEAEPGRPSPATPSQPETAPPGSLVAARPESADAGRVEPVRTSAIVAEPPPASPVSRADRAPAPETVASARPDAEAELAAAPQAQATRSRAPEAPARGSERLTSTRSGDEARPAAALPVQPAEDSAPAQRTQAQAPATPDNSQRIRAPLSASARLERASPADAMVRTGADERPSTPDLERPTPQSVQRLASADSDPVEPASGPAPAEAPQLPQGLRRSADVPVTVAEPAQEPPPPERLTAHDGRPALRGTLPPALILPREPDSARSPGANDHAPVRRGGLRIGTTPTVERASGRTSPTVPRRTASPAERLAAQPPQAATSRGPSAPTDAPPAAQSAATAAQPTPQQRSALAPAPAARRAQATDQPPSGSGDPAARFTRRYEAGECFFPLRLASRDDGAIRGYGVEAESVHTFRQAFARALGSDPHVDWRPLTDAQCSGISFTRVILGNSTPSLQIGLRHKELEPGQDLAGRVTGNRLAFLTLLIVDDSGIVHNIFEYLQHEPDQVAFSVPVHPVDDGTDRVQLIMAVGASRPLPALESTDPVHSDDFFPELLRQARDASAAVELGLEDFVIRGGAS